MAIGFMERLSGGRRRNSQSINSASEEMVTIGLATNFARTGVSVLPLVSAAECARRSHGLASRGGIGSELLRRQSCRR
jgi:hypothetical protein